MITYVNTVLVSNRTSDVLLSQAPAAASSMNTASSDAGKFVIMTLDEHKAKVSSLPDPAYPYINENNYTLYDTIKIGLVTKKNSPKVNYKTGKVTYEPIIKWSNIIKQGEVKSYNELKYAADTEDKCYIDFNGIDNATKTLLALGGKRVIVRLTFKDLPTRFRKWTESYEYVTEAGDTEATMAANIAAMINKQYKRARVVAVQGTVTRSDNAFASFASSSSGKAIELTAMPYDDDNTVDSLNWANKVRFNVNVYYTDPAAEGWESTNKNFPKGVIIDKVPGNQYAASAKLVRDRESQAMGYQGILNRGEGTWPIVKPEMETDLSKTYDAITLEFERTYRAADDIFRKTKETVEIYGVAYGDNHPLDTLKSYLRGFINNRQASKEDGYVFVGNIEG